MLAMAQGGTYEKRDKGKGKAGETFVDVQL